MVSSVLALEVPYTENPTIIHGNGTWTLPGKNLTSELLVWKAHYNVSDGTQVSIAQRATLSVAVLVNGTRVDYFLTSSDARYGVLERKIWDLERNQVIVVVIFIVLVFIWARNHEVS